MDFSIFMELLRKGSMVNGIVIKLEKIVNSGNKVHPLMNSSGANCLAMELMARH